MIWGDKMGILLVTFALIIPLTILGLILLVEYILKRTIKPSKEYLDEAANLKISKKLNLFNSILIFIIIIVSDVNFTSTKVLLIVFIVAEGIRDKCILDYLNNKNESTTTRKYIVFRFIILTALVISLYLLFVAISLI